MDYQQLQERVSELLKLEQYETLIEVYTEALTYGYPKRHEGEIYSALAELYGHFDDNEKSIDHYSSAITIFKALESESGEGSFYPVIAAVANNLGILYESDNENKAAAEKFETLKRGLVSNTLTLTWVRGLPETGSEVASTIAKLP